MTELVVCSGKGGTGKTSVTAALADLADDAVLADADVDAANLHLLLDPRTERCEPFVAGRTATVRPGACIACGTCAELCRFGAVVPVPGDATPAWYRIDPTACEGCGVCARFCPEGAVDLTPRRCGSWSVASTRRGPLVHARLDPGAENSGKLVTLVREEARRLSARTGRGLLLVDGPPGIGCPVTAALAGADLALVVTEPGLSALHDLARILELAAHFEVPAAVVVNKHDLHPALADLVAARCAERGVPVIGRIPFEPRAGDALHAGLSLVEHAPDGATAAALRRLWQRLLPRLRLPTPEKG